MSGLKNRVRFPSTISKEHLVQLRELSKETGIPMSVLMDQGLSLLFKQYEQDSSKSKTVKDGS